MTTNQSAHRRAEAVVIGKRSWSLELLFSANTTVRPIAAVLPIATNSVRIGGSSALVAP